MEPSSPPFQKKKFINPLEEKCCFLNNFSSTGKAALSRCLSPGFVGAPRRNFPFTGRRHYSSGIKCGNSDALHFKGGKGMDGFHELQLKVRDYELDQYGVVNNRNYSGYCEHGFLELLGSIGLNTDAIVRTGDAIAFTEFSLKFIAPLRSQDRFLMKVRLNDTSATTFFLEYFIMKLPRLEPILEARSTVVWLDKNFHPVRIPSYARSKIAQYLQQEEEK